MNYFYSIKSNVFYVILWRSPKHRMFIRISIYFDKFDTIARAEGEGRARGQHPKCTPLAHTNRMEEMSTRCTMSNTVYLRKTHFIARPAYLELSGAEKHMVKTWSRQGFHDKSELIFGLWSEERK